MTLSPIAVNSNDWHDALTIYLDSFPEEERRPVENLRDKAMNDSRFTFYVAKEGNEVVGFITTWNLGKFVYGEHLAIRRDMRGHNLGSKIITSVVSASSLPFILEVERLDELGITADQLKQREARLRFYHRHDFKESLNEYIQPPYGDGLKPVPLMLMEYGGNLLSTDFDEVQRMIHRGIYGVG